MQTFSDTTGSSSIASDDARGQALVRLRQAIIPLARQFRLQAVEPFTPTQLSVLGSINRHGPISLGDVAVRERLSLPSVSRVVRTLETEGVVARTADADDRRVSLVSVSPDGQRWIERTRTRRDAWLAERLESLTTAELETLNAAIPVLERLLQDDER